MCSGGRATCKVRRFGKREAVGELPTGADGFFEALGIPLIEGRFLETSDRERTLNAVIVNQTMVNAYCPDGSALGTQFRMTTDIDTIWRTVIGVVGDVKQTGLDQGAINTTMYLPHSQFPSTANFSVRSMTLVVRVLGDPTSMARTITEEIRRMDPNVPVSSIRTMDEVVVRTTADQRFQGIFNWHVRHGRTAASVGGRYLRCYQLPGRAKNKGNGNPSGTWCQSSPDRQTCDR